MKFSKESQDYYDQVLEQLKPLNKDFKYYMTVLLYVGTIVLMITLLYSVARMYWYYDAIKPLIAVGIWGIIRWGLKFINILRVLIYRRIYYPMLRRKNKGIKGDIKEINVIVPTYKEKDWITYAVFKSISIETAKTDIPVNIVVNTSDEGDINNINETLKEFPLKNNTKLVIIRQQGKGKRNALAESLKYIQEHADRENGVVIFMDGDSIWGEDLLLKTIPFFENNPKTGGLTTDEELVSFGSEFYNRWFDHRLALRDYYMSSHALSKRLLCLTGRFSLVRSELALRPEFIEMVEDDHIHHWLWGRIKFLGGDDKSTWFWVYKNGHKVGKPDFIYVKDALVYTIECIDNENGYIRAHQNLKRWFTNTARNNTRSMMILPFFRAPFFIWLAIVLQRLTMFTNFFGIATAVTLSIVLDPIFIPAFLYLTIIGALFSTLMFSINRKRLLFWGPLIHINNQWIGNFIKLWAFSHIAQQKWAHRGGQKMGVSKTDFSNVLRLWYCKYEFGMKIALIIFIVLIMTGVISPISELRILLGL